SPDADGESGWVSFLNGGNSPEALAGAFMASAEFNQQAFSENIKHVIVIYQENWSFDSLYGFFPGANGLFNSADHLRQVDKVSGAPLNQLPQPLDASGKPDAFPRRMDARRCRFSRTT